MRARSWRRLGVPATTMAFLLLMAATPRAAEAQLGWIKKLLGKKSSPAQSQQAAATGGGGAQSNAQGGTTGGPGGQDAAVAGPGASPGAAQTQGTLPSDAATQAANAAAKAEYDKRLAYGRSLDQQPRTLQSVKDRLQFWEGMKLTPPFNPDVHAAYAAAQRDLEEVTREDSVKKASDARLSNIDKKLNMAVTSLRANSFSDVISITDDILAEDPGNARAQQLRMVAENGEKGRRLKITLFALGAAALALFVLLSVFAKKIFKKEGGEAPAASGGAAPSGGGGGRKAYIKVVDGVGRGKLVAIQGDVFRIGSVASDDDAERNDLVISDSLSAVSRHHCAIVRKGRDYYLLDSSRNGTRLNTRPLARGDERRLRDGDEFTLADVSRLKFVKT